MAADIGILGAAGVEAGVATWQINVAVGNDNDDVEPCGEVDVFQALGLTALPHGKTDEGYAEGVFLRDCGGKDVVCVGARDTRNAKLVGRLKPGDTTMHSTGPGSVAQCFVKANRQAGLATDDTDKKSMMFLLDGKNKKAQWAARGAMIQIDTDGSITFTAKGGASLKLDDKVYILGDLSLPGLNGFLMQCASPASPPGAGALAMTAVFGVSK